MTGTFARRATLIAALAAFAAATALAHEPAQPGAPAAMGHPGLQVLPKDIPHDRLITVMKGFSTALGVKCTYCHVENGTKMDFASDAKKEKQTARAMMLMVRRINEQDFQVKDWKDTKVTCFTCHRGATKPLVAPPPAAPPAAAAAPTG